MALNLITDRTQADITHWRNLKAKGYEAMTEAEKEEWYANLKGSYNASDLNRVTEAMEYLARRFNQYGYAVTLHHIKDLWTMDDIPTEDDMEKYLDNVSRLRAVFAVLKTTPNVPPDMVRLTYQEANAIEQILTDINTVIERTFRSFKRSGQFTFWSGNQPLPAAESDLGRNWEQLDAMNTTWRNWQVADWYLLLYGNLKAEGDVE